METGVILRYFPALFLCFYEARWKRGEISEEEATCWALLGWFQG